MVNKITELLTEAIRRKVFPGCVVGVIVKDQSWYKAFGKMAYESNARLVTGETVYDTASITKAIPVSCLALKMIEEGVLSTEDRVCSILPEFAQECNHELVTVRHLLTHTVDFGFRLSSEKDNQPKEIIRKIMSAPLRSEPGKVFCYANATSIILGFVLEQVAGMTLDTMADRYLFGPLEMHSSTFHPEDGRVEIIAPSENDPWRQRIICGEVHDESAYALRPKVVGSAGLFSTVPDIMKFMEMLIGKGVYLGKKIVREETVKAMHTNAIPELKEACTGLGWELNQSFMGKLRSPETFGKTGFTGCSVTVNPTVTAGIVLLSNHQFPRRTKDRSIINQLRAECADLVFTQALKVQ